MLIPLATGRIVDGAIAEGDRGQLHLLVLGMLGVLLAAVSAGLVQRWLLARVAVRFDGATLDHITERLLALPATTSDPGAPATSSGGLPACARSGSSSCSRAWSG